MAWACSDEPVSEHPDLRPVIEAAFRAQCDELTDEFWKTAGVITFATMGVSEVLRRTGDTRSARNPDPLINISDRPPDGTPPQASWRWSQLEDATKADGWFQQWLTDAWLALIYSRWEDHYRPALAHIVGAEPKAVVSDVMGDIRHLRNDVTHHRGIATKANTGRCKVLTRFKAGDRIRLTPEDVLLLHSAIEISAEY